MVYFLLLPLFWILRAIFDDVDPIYLSRLCMIDPMLAVRALFREHRIIIQALQELCTMSIFVLGTAWFVRNRDTIRAQRIHQLLFTVYTFIGVLSVLQYAGFLTAVFPQRWSFWMGIERFGGLFTDPNALGLCAALCVLIALQSIQQRRSAFYVCALLVWCFLGLVSGSRTFVLITVGAVVLFFIPAVIAFYRSTKHRTSLVLCILLGVLCMPFVVSLLASYTNLTGIHRLAKLMHPATVVEELSSRAVFFRVNLALFAQHPWFGVGFNAFDRAFAATSAALGFATGRWQDNPNSFYLGICSELGLAGLMLFLLGIFHVRWRWSTNDQFLTAGGYAFFLALIVGCHLDFIEVSLLAPCVVQACIASVSPMSLHMRRAAVTVLILAAIFLVLKPHGAAGFYRRDDGIYVRRVAHISLPCGKTIIVDAPLLSKGREPCTVMIGGQSVKLIDATPIEVSLPACEKEQLVEVSCSRFFLADRPYCVRLR
jgi:O-antigen ligase